MSLILGFKPDEEAAYRNRNIGFVFQDHLLLPHLTMLEKHTSSPTIARRITSQEIKDAEDYAER